MIGVGYLLSLRQRANLATNIQKAHRNSRSKGTRTTRAGRMAMATYILLVNFTEQGVSNAKDTLRRADAFKEIA